MMTVEELINRGAHIDLYFRVKTEEEAHEVISPFKVKEGSLSTFKVDDKGKSWEVLRYVSPSIKILVHVEEWEVLQHA